MCVEIDLILERDVNRGVCNTQKDDVQAHSRFERSQKFSVNQRRNQVGKTASASFLSKHIALMASYCSLLNSSYGLPSFFKENSVAL